MRTARYALYCGTAAGLASMAAVMLAGWFEGSGAVRPINATSHFLWGEKAARSNEADLRHTVPGVITNQAAGTFWGTLFGVFLASRPPRTPLGMLRDAAIMGLPMTKILLWRGYSYDWLSLSPAVGFSDGLPSSTSSWNAISRWSSPRA